MALCPSCNSEVLAGVRWCSICHSNVINPDLGHLASPGKRLGAYLLDSLVLVMGVVVFGAFVSAVGVNGSGAGMGGGVDFCSARCLRGVVSGSFCPGNHAGQETSRDARYT